MSFAVALINCAGDLAPIYEHKYIMNGFRGDRHLDFINPLLAASPDSPRFSGWNIITANNLDEVQDLLEALEGVGFAEQRVMILSVRRFAVVWR
jgi:hypothetical protein